MITADFVEDMADNFHQLTISDTIDVASQDMNKDNPRELKIRGGFANLDAGLALVKGFFDAWRSKMDSGILYFLSPHTGNYGIIDVCRLTDDPVPLTNHISVKDVYVYGYQCKCVQLMECIDGILQTIGITEWELCLAAAIYEFLVEDAESFFFELKYDEKVKFGLSYAKKNNKKKFTQQHAKLISSAQYWEHMRKSYGLKFGQSFW